MTGRLSTVNRLFAHQGALSADSSAQGRLAFADALYNQLLSRDVGSMTAFEPLLAATSMARTLREAGKRAHGAARAALVLRKRDQ